MFVYLSKETNNKPLTDMKNSMQPLTKKQVTKIEEIKLQADKIWNLEDLPQPSFIYNVANAELRFNGFYSFTDTETQSKIFIGR